MKRATKAIRISSNLKWPTLEPFGLGEDLTFDELTMLNIRRVPQFKNRRGERAHKDPNGRDWSVLEWLGAAAGEVGEACNIAKKVRRGDFGKPGTVAYRDAMQALSIEIADAVIYLDIACRQTGFRLSNAIAYKFNLVSARVRSDVFVQPPWERKLDKAKR